MVLILWDILGRGEGECVCVCARAQHVLSKNRSRYKRNIYLIKSPTNFLFFYLCAFNGGMFTL